MEELFQELQKKRPDLLQEVQQNPTDSQNIELLRRWLGKRGREAEQFIEFLKQ